MGLVVLAIALDLKPTYEGLKFHIQDRAILYLSNLKPTYEGLKLDFS